MSLATSRSTWPVLAVALLVTGMALWRNNAPPNALAIQDIGPYLATIFLAGAAISVFVKQEARIAALEHAINRPER